MSCPSSGRQISPGERRDPKRASFLTLSSSGTGVLSHELGVGRKWRGVGSNTTLAYRPHSISLLFPLFPFLPSPSPLFLLLLSLFYVFLISFLSLLSYLPSLPSILKVKPRAVYVRQALESCKKNTCSISECCFLLEVISISPSIRSRFLQCRLSADRYLLDEDPRVSDCESETIEGHGKPPRV